MVHASARGRPGDCRCGHARSAHEHYRRGTDCALCTDCPRYRPAGGLLGRLRRRLARG